jgi:hypothetical protein
MTMKDLRGFPFTAGVGASGVLYAGIAVFALCIPDARLTFAFLPMIPIPQLQQLHFPAREALQCMVAADLVGLLLGWRFFDGHAAHLSGAAAG